MSFGDVLFGFCSLSEWVRNKWKNTKTFFGSDYKTASSFEDKVVKLEDLEPGDHISIPGSHSYAVKQIAGSVAYYHHGIYLGEIDGVKTVTDFGRANQKYPVLCTLDEFLRRPNGEQKSTEQLYKRVYKDSQNLLSVPKSINLAEEMNGSVNWGDYFLPFNNCETYATYIKTGIPYSDQASFIQGFTPHNRYIRESRTLPVMAMSAREYHLNNILGFGIGTWVNKWI